MCGYRAAQVLQSDLVSSQSQPGVQKARTRTSWKHGHLPYPPDEQQQFEELYNSREEEQQSDNLFLPSPTMLGEPPAPMAVGLAPAPPSEMVMTSSPSSSPPSMPHDHDNHDHPHPHPQLHREVSLSILAAQLSDADLERFNLDAF